MDEQRLAGGNTGGAIRVGDTVRRTSTPPPPPSDRPRMRSGARAEHGSQARSSGTTTPPYNAAWSEGHLVGFFDWNFAAPVTPQWDLAFTATRPRLRRGHPTHRNCR
jgi:hypothetical protein